MVEEVFCVKELGVVWDCNIPPIIEVPIFNDENRRWDWNVDVSLISSRSKISTILTVWVFSQAVGNYEASEASSSNNIVIRAIYGGWISKDDGA